MKLAAHYNKASIIISVSVLLFSGIVYYLTINHIARKQLDTDLTEEIEEMVDYVNVNHRLPKPLDFDEDETTFVKTNDANFTTVFFDAPFFNDKQKEHEPGRAISTIIKLNGQNYIATVIESRADTEDLIQIIFVITIILSAVLLIISIVTNRYVLNGLWRPFYHILNQVQKFNIADTSRMEVIEAKVDEFRDLSDAVSKMSARVTTDYQGLKMFTENASHEMMTPLAVITSKLDMLIQDETLRSDQFSQINDIYSAASRLSRLNQSLLLLVKIDKKLFPDIEKVNIRSIILDKTQQFHELIQNKNIELDISVDDLELNTSKYLIDVLINNLFSNAIRHNKTGGKIQIELSGKKLLFQNSGEETPLDKESIFERFYKAKASEGTGLGLAIMKNICNQYNFELKYRYINNMHSFEIDF